MSFTSLLISLGLGVSFGAILQRVQASSPDRIVGTLTLRDLTILKFMMLAIGVGAMGIGLLTALSLAHLSVKGLLLFPVVVGGLVFGIGFGLGGYCPGTCLVGAAEGRRDALFTIAGGLLGVFVYALVHPFVEATVGGTLDFGKPTLATATGMAPGLMGLVFGALMTALAFVLPTHPGQRISRPGPPGAPGDDSRSVVGVERHGLIALTGNAKTHAE